MDFLADIMRRIMAPHQLSGFQPEEEQQQSDDQRLIDYIRSRFVGRQADERLNSRFGNIDSLLAARMQQPQPVEPITIAQPVNPAQVDSGTSQMSPEAMAEAGLGPPVVAYNPRPKPAAQPKPKPTTTVTPTPKPGTNVGVIQSPNTSGGSGGGSINLGGSSGTKTGDKKKTSSGGLKL